MSRTLVHIMTVDSTHHQAFKKIMQKYHRMVPCDACHIFQVFGGIQYHKVWRKTNWNLAYYLMNILTLTIDLCAWLHVHETLLAQQFTPTLCPEKAGLSWIKKSRLIKMRYDIFFKGNPQNSICILSWLSWISLDRNSSCHGSKNDGWQMNAMTCCNKHNRYICLREESTWIVFHVVFLLILIFHNLCAFPGWVGANCSHENSCTQRPTTKVVIFVKQNVTFQFVFTKTHRVPTEHMEYTAH